MNEEAHFLLKCWEAVSDWIPNSDKQNAADALVESFIEAGNTLSDLYDADGECAHIDKALQAAQTTHDEENDFDEEDDDR